MTAPRLWSRRGFLGALGAASALVAVGCAAPPGVSSGTRRRPLAIPPLAPSTLDDRGRRVFDLVAAPSTASFRAGSATPTWGFGGLPFGGPTLRARRGEEVLVRVANRTDETTTLHWHGMSVPPAMDGGPHRPIAPGATWTPTWRIDQPAATLWYHPHPHGRTERHVHRGLFGLFLVDDDDAVNLPACYGVDDVPVVVTDRRLTPGGAFDEESRNALGLLGDTLLVNGTVDAFHEVTTTRLRLRLLNASPARTYRFALDDRPLTVLATDQGLLPAPRVTDGVLLTPGERAEVVVDVDPARPMMLRSVPHDLGAVNGTERAAGGADRVDVLELRPAPRLTASPPVPAVLGRTPALAASAATVTRTFALSENLINGRAMDMTRVDEVVLAGATEIWEITNTHSRPHNLHVHDARLQVLEAAGRAVPENARPWKDTVYIAPRTTTRALVRFGRHADPQRPVMYHCHLLAHEDHGMMGQFVLVAPGQRPTLTVPAAGHHHG